MELINMHKAKSSLSELVQKVLAGERVIICNNNIPVVELSIYQESGVQRTPGILKSKIWSSEDCWDSDSDTTQSIEDSEIFPE